MDETAVRTEPFRFYTRLHLTELTGSHASNLWQMAWGIKRAPDACIYHHTHRFLQQRQSASPEPPNDFAYWISNVLGEKELGERLASIDTARFCDIRSLRDAISAVIERHIRRNVFSSLRFVDKASAFFFMKSISFIMPTGYTVSSIKEMAAVMKVITTDSIYFHMFEAKMRLGHQTNDFSNWIESSLGKKDLAAELARLDPYTHTIEELRSIMIRILEKYAGG